MRGQRERGNDLTAGFRYSTLRRALYCAKSRRGIGVKLGGPVLNMVSIRSTEEPGPRFRRSRSLQCKRQLEAVRIMITRMGIPYRGHLMSGFQDLWGLAFKSFTPRPGITTGDSLDQKQTLDVPVYEKNCHTTSFEVRPRSGRGVCITSTWGVASGCMVWGRICPWGCCSSF